ncbi:uncharacterized protein LOC117105485 [Anneissia japonica]|uniref:uncharacterized protein LOC117105485 n=1 Tax=Anneissia japonica TaxID=1529436 RepID=UPI001425A6A6|nr:uncharacterized protein LOC117105485 [Anneissia japonica]
MNGILFSFNIFKVAKIASECGISKPMLNTVLDYLNDIGIILYSKTNEKLKYTVITNLRMMIDVVTKIITVVKPDDIDKLPTLMHLWNTLDSEGILQEQLLLRHLWRHQIKKDASNFEVFIELMKVFGLLFEKQKWGVCMGLQKSTKWGIKLLYLQQQLKTVYVTTEGVGYELRVYCHACEPTLRPLYKLEECFDDSCTQETLNFLALHTLIVGRGIKELRRYFLDKANLTKSEVKPFLTRESHGLLMDVDFGDD